MAPTPDSRRACQLECPPATGTTGIVLMQLGGNGGASRRRFPLVAFEAGLSEPAYSESVLRLAAGPGPALPTGSTLRPARPGVDSECNLFSQRQ